MKEQPKDLFISRKKLEQLPEEERQEVYRVLGKYGLLPNSRPNTPEQRQRTTLVRAYPEFEELDDEQIARVAAVIPTYVEAYGANLPPHKRDSLINCLRRWQKYTSGEPWRKIARDEKMRSVGALHSSITRLTNTLPEIVDAQTLFEVAENLKNQQTPELDQSVTELPEGA